MPLSMNGAWKLARAMVIRLQFTRSTGRCVLEDNQRVWRTQSGLPSWSCSQTRALNQINCCEIIIFFGLTRS
jgi:hypothetical protein